ncbi:MAG: CapA family protein [Undibacterium sp.]|uniref:CapA family protein n=1 Tax=Undibacterium sp. TaxID=1914977 RepID=UPI002720A2BB|nr:CapA family protein [Undibacterium sp.]MDO8651815.1 CapA family protein [Undibacterium sp.]
MANSPQAGTVRLILGGDVMLGRHVGQHIAQQGADYPLGAVAGLMRAADLTIVNLECAITPSADIWSGAPKAFYFGAPPQAINTLLGAGIDMVCLANNHILDFGVRGLLDTIKSLETYKIGHAGAGIDIAAAASAALAERHGLRFGMVAFCDHQEDFAVQPDRPGMAYLDIEDEHATITALRKALRGLRGIAVDWPILSLHWGPNMVFQPSTRFRRVAHAAIDMGWKIIFGHSAHVFQGVELYRDCPIIYAAGDLIDDYTVDKEFKNDHQLLFELEIEGSRLVAMHLHPVFIANCRTGIASQQQSEYISRWMTKLCSELGTRLQQEDGKLTIRCAHSRPQH